MTQVLGELLLLYSLSGLSVGGYYPVVNSLTDQQLLRDYTERGLEAAFAELLRRHVDFVYSAAFRMVDDAHLAEDVTQGVFLALAKNARQLTDRPTLSGWLHRTARNLAANTVRSNVRRRAREQSAAAMIELHSAEPEADWECVAPHLDDALGELSDVDRDALLLRYFQCKSAREIAETLGISEDAAQKRLSRAVERLRDFLSTRGVTVGASGLVLVISSNAVQAAPIGLSAAITSALAGTTLAAAATASAMKVVAMTAFQKSLIAAAFIATIGAGIYEARQASTLRTQLGVLQEQQAPLAAQIQQLTRDRDDAKRQLALLGDDDERLKRNTSELLALRAEVTRLRSNVARAAAADDPIESAAKSLVERVNTLKQKLEATPGARIPELQLLTAGDWADAAKGNLDTENDFRKAFSTLRDWGVRNFLWSMSAALRKYTQAHNDNLPSELAQLKPYLETAPSDEMLQRYQIVSRGVLPSASGSSQEWSITLKEVIDADNDTLYQLGRDGGVGGASYRDADALNVLGPAMKAFAANAPTNGEGRVAFSPQQLLPYLKTPEEKAAYEKLTGSKSPDLK